MTCPEARDQLSSLLDDALDGAERQALERHLTGCAECRRELAELRATLALLGRLPAPHAPAGFVDRVMAATHRPAWPRRVLDALFVPLRVKLPLEAAAVLFVGVSALYVYQHTPEVRDLARQETPAPAPAPASPAAPGPPSPPPAARPAAPERAATPATPRDRAPEAPRAAADPGKAREHARPVPPAPPGTLAPDARDVRTAPSTTPRAKLPDAPAPPVPMAEQTAPAPTPTAPPVSTGPPVTPTPPPAKPAAPLGKTAEPLPPPAVQPAEKPAEKKEALAAGRSDGSAPASSSTGSEQGAKSNEPSAPRDTAGAGTRLPPSAARSTPPSVAPPVAAPRGGEGGAPSAPPPDARSESATARAPVARRLMRAVDASGRLVVPAREPAETALDALLGRLGARRVERRLEGDRGLVLIDVLVPGARYRELIEGLGQIGRWTTEHEPRTLPAQLRVEVALTVEP